MSMFHLEYPRRRGFFHWDELACLARALGFPGEIFYNNIPDEYLQENEDHGLKLKEVLFLVNVQKCFNRAVDRTINIHTDEWNLCVIQKALHLVDINAVMYEELYNIRVAFQVYENADTKGLPLTEKTLQRTIKLCNRMISPLKMMQRIKHMKDDFEEEGRIQLHEFLDLILWCEIFEELMLSAPDLDIAKDAEEDLYNIENFETMLTHYDELLAQRLNAEYRAEELTFVKAKHQSKAMPKDIPPVDPEKRKKLVKYHKENFQYLKNELQLSARNCHQTKAGYVRGRPITAPDLIMYDAIDPSMRVSTLDPRPATVFDTIGHLIRPLTPQRTVMSRADIQHVVPRPEINRYQRSITPAAVSQEEKLDHVNRMKSLGFETATLDHKYDLILDEEMKEYMPGYKEKLAMNPRLDKPPTPKKEILVMLRGPDEEVLKNMAYHKREPPRPAHGKACDARHRGWHKSRVKKGSHYILTTPSFEKSQTGLLQDKLSKTFYKEGNLDNFTYRYTKREEILPEKPISRAKNALQPLDVQQVYLETQRPQETHQQGMKKGELGAPYRKSSKISVASTGKSSSDVSWHNLKLYKEDSSESLNNGKSKIERGAPEFEVGQGKMVALGTVGKVEVLEQIKEESGRTTRQSGIHGKASKTPLGMLQLAKTVDEKLSATVEEDSYQNPVSPQEPSISVEKQTPAVSLLPVSSDRAKVIIQTPRTQLLTETLGLGDSFMMMDGGPLKASTAKGQKGKASKKEERKKLDCMQRLSQRVDGMVSSAMRRKLLSVDLNHLALPVPGKQMWGKGLTLVGMDSRPTTVM